jgi:hypothetical protein
MFSHNVANSICDKLSIGPNRDCARSCNSIVQPYGVPVICQHSSSQIHPGNHDIVWKFPTYLSLLKNP